MNFGPQTSEEDSHAIMDHALELGINFFDTANVYGWKKGEGVTEQIIGRWFAQGGERREKTVIATKLYGSMGDWPNDTFLSARNIRRACDAIAAPAADRLHRPLPDAPRRPEHAVGGDLGGDGGAPPAGQGPLRRLVELRRLAHRQGASEAATRATSSAWSPSSPSTTCSSATIELEVLPACAGLRPRRHPVVARCRAACSAALSARRTKASAGWKAGPRNRSRRTAPAIEAYEEFCAELGHDPAHVGLAWLLAQPG